jgi:hypothetical protein
VTALGDMQLPCRDPATQQGSTLADAVRAVAFGADAPAAAAPAPAPAPAPGRGAEGGTPGYIPAPADPPSNAPGEGPAAQGGGGGGGGGPAGWRAALLAGVVTGSVLAAALLGFGAYHWGYRRWWRHRGWQREELAEGGIGMVAMPPSGAQQQRPVHAAGQAAAAPAVRGEEVGV